MYLDFNQQLDEENSKMFYSKIVLTFISDNAANEIS